MIERWAFELSVMETAVPNRRTARTDAAAPAATTPRRPPPPGASPRSSWPPFYLVPAIVALAAFLPFVPALGATFVTWDDNRNFLDNPYYRGLGWEQLRWMWTTFHMGHYVPLSWMTLGLDYELWGMNPVGYHLQNILLHAANAVLVYVLARRILTPTTEHGGDDPRGGELPSAVAALVFAIHPLRVESVAWVTERRDMLSLLFALGSTLAYLRFCAERASNRGWYLIALALFACALLSKASVMTLPAVLLILNVYPRRSLGGAAGWWSASARRVYVEVAPFVVLAGAWSALTLVALDPPRQLGLAEKIAVSAYSLAFYVWKTFVPAGLAPLYEMPPHVDPLAPRYVASYLLVAALSVAAVGARRRWPGATAAWFAFVVITLPMLGIVQNGPQIAADRYTYHAAPVLGVLAGGALSRWRRRPLAVGVLAGAVLSVLAALAWQQTKVWRDSDRMWSRVLSVDSTSSIAQIAMGDLRIEQGRFDEAAYHYARGVAIDADYAEGHNNLGVALSRLGRFAEAVEEFRTAVALDSGYADAYANWGVALSRLGDDAGAVERYRRAIALDSNHADARVNYANALLRLGRAEAAIAEYRAADRMRSRNADTHLNWGVALAQLGRYADAAEHFRTALAIDPASAEARKYLDAAISLGAREGKGGARREP